MARMGSSLERRRPRQCSACGPRWVAAVAALAGVAVMAALATIDSVRRGGPLIGAPHSWVTQNPLMLPWWYLWLYLMLRWVSHYRHEPRPRTRYLLVRVGWGLLVVVAGTAVSKLIAPLLIH